MLLVKEFLKTKTIGELAKEYGVYCTFSKDGIKFSLNYDQIEVKDSDLLSQQCRGLILASIDGKSLLSKATFINNKLNYDNVVVGDTIIVAYPMNRFFNATQHTLTNVNWNDNRLSIQEKLDGTLAILYFSIFDNCWNVGTRNIPEADFPIDNSTLTFRGLFEICLKDTVNLSFNEFTEKLDKNYTYNFEICSLVNQVVVKYTKNNLVFLAARNLSSLKEEDILSFNFVKELNFPVPKKYSLNSLNDIINYVNAQDPKEHEGVVVVDSNFNRLKVKNINYSLYNRIKFQTFNDRAFLSLILNEKDDDILPILHETFQKRILELKEKLKLFKNNINEQLESSKHCESRKDFALFIKDKYWTPPLFYIYGNKGSLNDFINENKTSDGDYFTSFIDNLLSQLNILN